MAPDVATIVKHRTKKNMWNDHHESYRVTSYLKTVPRRPPEESDKIEMQILRELFFEWYPNWNYEYKFIWCTREEATHVSCSGICGAVIALDDPNWDFTNEYVNWPQKTIDEARESSKHFIGEYADLVRKGEWHD